MENVLVRPLRPVICPPACFEVQPCLQSPFEVRFPLPEGLNGDDGRRFRRVCEAANKAARAYFFYYPHGSLQHIFVRAN